MKFGMVFLIWGVIFSSCSNKSSKKINYNSISMSTNGCHGKCILVDYKIIKNQIFFNLEKNIEPKGQFYLDLAEKDLELINNFVKIIFKEKIEKKYFDFKTDTQIIAFYLKSENKKIQTIYKVHLEPYPIDKLNEYVFDLFKKNKKNLVEHKKNVLFESKTLLN
jgi:hypothetical protein